MQTSLRCQVCDLAFEMRKSEAQFYEEFDLMERAQLLATYRSRAKRENVVVKYPLKQERTGPRHRRSRKLR